MMNNEEASKNEILDKMRGTEEMIKRVQNKNEKEHKQKARENEIKRKEKEENVKRIERMNEYHREKIMERIDMDNEKADKVRIEKEALLETRQKLRKKIDREKEEMNSAFQKAKIKGKFDPNDFKQIRSIGGSANNNVLKRSEDFPAKKTKKKHKNKNKNTDDWYYSERKDFLLTPKYKSNLIYNEPIPEYEDASIYDKIEKPKYNYNDEQKAIKNINELRNRLQKELTDIIDKEQEKEDERDQVLKTVII